MQSECCFDKFIYVSSHPKGLHLDDNIGVLCLREEFFSVDIEHRRAYKWQEFNNIRDNKKCVPYLHCLLRVKRLAEESHHPREAIQFRVNV